MNLIKGLMGGMIAGVIGACAWAAITYYANVEIGYLAWGIGALVGFAVAAASSGGGAAAGVVAVLITILSICGGKYVGSYWAIDKIFAEFNDTENWTEENYIAAVANDVLTEEQSAGNYVDFEFSEDAEGKDAYPENIWSEASTQWSEMDPTAQDEFKTYRQQEVTDEIAEIRGTLAWGSFTSSFGPVDIVFFLLGVVTAWKIAYIDPVEA